MTALVADSQRPKSGPLFNERARKIAKGGGLNPPSFEPAVIAAVRAPGRAGPRLGFVMTTRRIEIDRHHSRAICQEIGERLRLQLPLRSELPAGLASRVAQFEALDSDRIQKNLTGDRFFTRPPTTGWR